MNNFMAINFDSGQFSRRIIIKEMNSVVKVLPKLHKTDSQY